MLDHLTDFPERDLASSATLTLFKSNRKLLLRVLEDLDNAVGVNRNRMADLGCGFGSLSMIVGRSLGFGEVYGVDIDEGRIGEANGHGLHATRCNIEKQPLPFPNEYFELVTSFGALEHIKLLDSVIIEARRVLRPSGCLLVSSPNLASWVNRIALLLGYQIRNLEISKSILAGVHGIYHDSYVKAAPAGHITSCTPTALSELLAYHGFRTVKLWGAGIIRSQDTKLRFHIKAIDSLLSRKLSLSIRFLLLAQKNGKSP